MQNKSGISSFTCKCVCITAAQHKEVKPLSKWHADHSGEWESSSILMETSFLNKSQRSELRAHISSQQILSTHLPYSWKNKRPRLT